MDNQSKKRKGGAEKLRDKKVKSLKSNAIHCKKRTELFGSSSTSTSGTATDPNVEVLDRHRQEEDATKRVLVDSELSEANDSAAEVNTLQ